MMKHKIAVIITYCTNDYKFIKHCINSVKDFASEIIVPVSDHFFDGTPENKTLLQKTFRENPEATFIRFKYGPSNPPILGHWFWKFIPRTGGLRPLFGSVYWICKARFIGYRHLSDNIDYVLFLDVDEIIDSNWFKEWLDTDEYKKFGAMKFTCYAYFRKPIYQATSYYECGLLVKKTAISEKSFFHYGERNYIYAKSSGKKKGKILGLDGFPMIHHYAWARPKKEMLKKVGTWGHNKDRNWEKLILKQFSYQPNEAKFIKSYKCKVVKPYIKF